LLSYFVFSVILRPAKFRYLEIVSGNSPLVLSFNDGVSF